ncbi:MAG TPA: hypothetical protein VKV05_07900 [Terriglobales bacterium]|nr:hypothetical protein [Terriglobales bacterium]
MATAHHKAHITRLEIDEVKGRRHEIVFVDARSLTSLKRNPLQVPGALHMPVKQLEKRAKLLPRNRTLVTYCT